MKKKVLLKSAAAVMSVFILAPCFGNVVFAEKPVRQCNQGKRKRCSTEESFTEEDFTEEDFAEEDFTEEDFTEEDFTEEIENSKVSKCKKAKLDPKEIVKYLSKNKVSYAKAGKEFGVSDVTVIKCVKKLADSESSSDLCEKAMEIINQHKKANLDPKAVVDHMYNNPGTYKKAAKLFGVPVMAVWRCVKKLADSKSSSDLREKAMEIINRNKRKNANLDPEAVVNHMYNNPGTYKEAAKLFGVSDMTVIKCVKKLRSDGNLLLREKAMEIINRINRNKHKNKNAKLDPEAVVKYLSENKESYRKVGKEFGVSAAPVRCCVKKLCSDGNLLLREKAMEIINRNKRKNAKLDPKEIVKYLSKNKESYRKVGKEFGVSAEAVRRCVKKLADSESSSDLCCKKAMEIINRNKHKNKNKNAKLDPEAVVNHMYNNPVTYKEAAKYFGVAVDTVWRCVKKLADSKSSSDFCKKAREIINRNKQKKSKLDTEAVVDHMYNNPGTYKEAAKYFGVSANTVWRCVKKLADSESSSDLCCKKAMEIINRNKHKNKNKNAKLDPEEDEISEFLYDRSI